VTEQIPEVSIREAHDETTLIALIQDSHDSGSVVATRLRTDDRVIARVTDGIYRQPASALRELISNAYDADATRVVIKTDAPRFRRILVEDDGRGMTPVALANLLCHIGGSAKRSERGANLGISDTVDPSKSPGGRPLIGKIGIGLFSVSQLTHAFQIVTKVADDPYRTVATVALRQYADNPDTDAEGKDHFEAGKVNIWRERAADTEMHGTSIILTSLRPQARDTLRSRDVWSAIEVNEGMPLGDQVAINPPKYHIGRLEPTDDTEQLLRGDEGRLEAVPWTPADSPTEAFEALVDAVWAEVELANPNPQLDRLFDYYLRMVWQLSLAVPLPYIDGHPFELGVTELAAAFTISNHPRGSADADAFGSTGTLRDALNLKDPVEGHSPFDIYFDDLKLRRPLRFRRLPETSHALKRSIMFVGRCREEFPGIPAELSGGPIEFEAYLFWTPKVAPKEHQGSLIRIHGSSGTLFDPTFLRYQVSELTRLRQITCEIFIHEGLDSALNIDRESFNSAHPHSVFVTKWLHSALRQLATAQKRLAAETRLATRMESTEAALSGIQGVAVRAWQREADDPAARPPGVVFADVVTAKSPVAIPDTYVFERTAVLPVVSAPRTSKSTARQAIYEEKLKAIAQVLASYGLLDQLAPAKQARLLKDLFEILNAPQE
jgi:hypothetical protein